MAKTFTRFSVVEFGRGGLRLIEMWTLLREHLGIESSTGSVFEVAPIGAAQHGAFKHFWNLRDFSQL